MRFRGLDAVRTVESRGHIDRGKEKKKYRRWKGGNRRREIKILDIWVLDIWKLKFGDSRSENLNFDSGKFHNWGPWPRSPITWT